VRNPRVDPDTLPFVCVLTYGTDVTGFTYFTLPENESKCLECVLALFRLCLWLRVVLTSRTLLTLRYQKTEQLRRDLLEDCPLDTLTTRCNTLQHAATH